VIALSVKYITFPKAMVNPLSFFRSCMIVALTLFLMLAGIILVCPCPARSGPRPPSFWTPATAGMMTRGAGSGGEYAEKHFKFRSSSLAQKIAGRLAARHRVELTRTADIGMTSADRAAVANHLRADLMISLHAAVAPYCGPRVAAVYYHNDERLKIPPEISIPSAGRPAWVSLQIRHQHQSQTLASTLKTVLTGTDVFESVTVYSAPLAPLLGADLPAVLVEVGCFHPTATLDAQAIERQLTDYADAIAKAIVTALPGLVP
jgi:N-acetylmuramoyl-L-alanine amidase